MIVVSIVLWVAVGLQVGLQDSESIIVIHTSGLYIRGGGGYSLLGILQLVGLNERKFVKVVIPKNDTCC